KTSWTSDRGELNAAVASAKATGATSLHDAAYAAPTLSDEQPGRGLVLIFSDGDDTASWLSGQSVIEIARRNDAVVYAVALRQPGLPAPGARLAFRSGGAPPV